LRGADIPGVNDYLPKKLRSGREYDLATEAWNLGSGTRIFTLDYGTAGERVIRGILRKHISNYKSEFRQAHENPLSSRDIQVQQQRLQGQWEEYAPVIHRKIKAMRSLGVPEDRIYASLQSSGSEERDYLLAGLVPPVFPP
jgi:hypothetical protein